MDSDVSITHPASLEPYFEFARDVYFIIANQEKTISLPPSLQALAFLLWGAVCDLATGEQIVGAYLNLTREKKKDHFLMEKLKDPDLKIVCKVFQTPDCNIECSFESLMQYYLDCSFETVDFKQSMAAATRTINSWISENTENKIPHMIQPDSVDETTTSLFVNTVYFKDRWKYKFPKHQTFDEPFYSTKDIFRNVPMMHIECRFKYLEEEFYKVVEIPYRNENFRLLILLPKDIDRLRELEEKLVEIEFRDMFSKLYDQHVCLTLPKFKMDHLCDEPKNVLQIHDMNITFGKNTVKFSEKSYSEEESPPQRGEIRHKTIVEMIRFKAVFEINEDGIEFAAITIPTPLSQKNEQKTKRISPRYEEKPVDFKVDHSFIFVILHQDTVLYKGTYIKYGL